MRRNLYLLPWLLLVAGCATTPPPPQALPALFAADALVTQRAVLTVRGRQFTLNGYLSLSAAQGKRLIVTENFGAVLADVLVKHDGAVHVMRSGRTFRLAWIRRYVVADMERVLAEASPVVLVRRGYTLEVRTVETKPGPQPPELFDETRKAPP